MSRLPGAFYIPSSIAQRASEKMPAGEGAALRRQLAFDALALVRELPCFAQGWMFVKRDTSKLSSLFRSSWMHFWAELRGGMLLFCEPNSDYDINHNYNQHHIKLVFTATNCIIDLKNTPSYSQIKIRRDDGQSIVLRLSNPHEAQQWVVALQAYTFQYTTIRLADFDWITAIGKGASGKVFLVRDNRTNARLALKVIEKSRVFRMQPNFQHVINERLVLELCSECPFVIQLRYAFQTDSHLYFATDFYDGGDVFSLLQSHNGRLSEHHARRIVAEIVLALSWLHERNIVYRDLKPENVVLDGDGHVRLADFGLAKVLKPEQNYLTQTICGTTMYAAPEMLQGKAYNVSLDLWCLGIFIYHILSGRTPFDFNGLAKEEMHHMQNYCSVRYNGLSSQATGLIKGLLQTDPLRRSTLEDVKRHEFFQGVDWVRVARKEPHPDDISQFVADKEQRNSVVGRLAVMRAQQLGGMDSHFDATMDATGAAKAFGRQTDIQEISSMTLDRYLLRNINPDEWRNVSFSDDDDISATAEFPAFVHKKGMEMETWAIAGWAWTCGEASGHSLHSRYVPPTGVIGSGGGGGNQSNFSSISTATNNVSSPLVAEVNHTALINNGGADKFDDNDDNKVNLQISSPTQAVTAARGTPGVHQTPSAVTMSNQISATSGRRSLPVFNEERIDMPFLQRPSVTGDVTRIASMHAARGGGKALPPHIAQHQQQVLERAGRPIDQAFSGFTHNNDANNTKTTNHPSMDHGNGNGAFGRPSLDVRARARRSLDVIHSNEGNAGGGVGGIGFGRRGGGAASVTSGRKFNFSRITGSVRHRASLDYSSGRARRSVDRISRGHEVIGGGQPALQRTPTIPRPAEKRHVKSSLDFGLGRSKGI